MANGQQEQQQDPTQIPQQQAQIQQQEPFNLYQALGSLNAPQMLQLKHNIGVYRSQKEIKRNVGNDRFMELMSEVNAGNTTLKAAVDRSKNELSPVMKELDALLYKRNEKGEYTATVEDFMTFRGRHPNMLSKEVARWDSHRGAISQKQVNQAKADLKFRTDLSKDIKDEMDTNLTNYSYASEGSTDFNLLTHYIEDTMKPYFETHEYTKAIKTAKVDGVEMYIPKLKKKHPKTGGEIDTSKKTIEKMNLLGEQLNYVRSEIAKNLNPDTYNSGDEHGILRALSAISNLIPAEPLRKKYGYINPSTGEMLPTLGKGLDDVTLRKYYLDELIAHYTRGKNHLSKIKEHVRNPMLEQQRQQQQQEEFPSITTAEEFDALPPGTVFIDPNGNKRTKP